MANIDPNMVLEALFPTAVGFFDLGRDLTTDEMDCILDQEKRTNVGNLTSTNSYILSENRLSDLKEFFDHCFNMYLTSIVNPKENIKLRITQSWLNYTEQNQYHHKHAHPNSYLSGVFFAKTNNDVDKIFFFKDGYQQLKIPPANWNIWNSESWWFSAGQGKLIVFPSSLNHMVESKLDNNLRISIAMNTFPIGSLGSENDLTQLIL